MKITVRIGDVEVIVDEPTKESMYPRMVTSDNYNEGISKSERMVEVIENIVNMAVKAHEDVHNTTIKQKKR